MTEISRRASFGATAGVGFATGCLALRRFPSSASCVTRRFTWPRVIDPLRLVFSHVHVDEQAVGVVTAADLGEVQAIFVHRPIGNPDDPEVDGGRVIVA